ncbi:unnamed protein product [Staurois parvus]|uniref:G-protein coupled receptors family 1 profile domain-containing protein n=1 Tax=Staurois parvus TaxID=386267 RepID=A0ABN9GP99_9NEOB|nr:unnamed protein product [Staurois parvus]
MRNQTILSEFVLSRLSDLPSLQLPLFLFFLLIYLLTLIWNFLIIVLIVTDSHLHVPMYFFLGNLAGLDLCSSSVTVPRMLFDLHTQTRQKDYHNRLSNPIFFFFYSLPALRFFCWLSCPTIDIRHLSAITLHTGHELESVCPVGLHCVVSRLYPFSSSHTLCLEFNILQIRYYRKFLL